MIKYVKYNLYEIWKLIGKKKPKKKQPREIEAPTSPIPGLKQGGKIANEKLKEPVKNHG